MIKLRMLVVGLGLVAGLAWPVAAQASGPLHNVGSGLCLSSLGVSNGGQAALWTCNGSYNQTWSAGTVAGFEGWYLSNAGDHLCLANHGGGSYDANYELMWKCSSDLGGANSTQQFLLMIDRYHQSYWQIETLNSNFIPTGYCLTDYGYTAVGTPVYMSACNSSLNQAWWEG